MKVLLLQLDGKLPSIALMRVAAHHKTRGDEVLLQHARKIESVRRGMFDNWDRVYASLIFTKTQPIALAVRREFPDALVGGTGWNLTGRIEDHGIGITSKAQDYSLWPAFQHSIGFTQRGCRLDCSFCVVRKKEGKVSHWQDVGEIWRGKPYPRELLLLDNDFFGQDDWRRKIAEMRAGGFKVCFSQGINARMLTDEAAEAIASIHYTDDSFSRRRIYTAWDNIGDEATLFRGLKALVRHGVKPDEIMVYVLIGYDDSEADRLYRQRKLREFGCRPYPMPFDRTDDMLMGFQRWVVRRADLKVPWDEYKAANCRPENVGRDRVPLPLFDIPCTGTESAGDATCRC